MKGNRHKRQYEDGRDSLTDEDLCQALHEAIHGDRLCRSNPGC